MWLLHGTLCLCSSGGVWLGSDESLPLPPAWERQEMRRTLPTAANFPPGSSRKKQATPTALFTDHRKPKKTNIAFL